MPKRIHLVTAALREARVLSAIGCHTTLKTDASTCDTVVFVADKIAWDQLLWERRATLGVIHPWFVDAYRQRVDTERHQERSRSAL